MLFKRTCKQGSADYQKDFLAKPFEGGLLGRCSYRRVFVSLRPVRRPPFGTINRGNNLGGLLPPQTPPLNLGGRCPPRPPMANAVLARQPQFSKVEYWSGNLNFPNQYLQGAFLLGAGVSKFSKMVIARNLLIPWEIYTHFWIALGEPYWSPMVRRSKTSNFTIFWKRALSY